MTYRIFLLEDRIPSLLSEMPEGRVKVGPTDEKGMTEVDITIEEDFDLLKLFHAGIKAGETPYQKKVG